MVNRMKTILENLRGDSSCRAAVLALALAFGAWSAHAGTIGVFTSGENGFDTHTFYYDDGKEVVLFDTQFVPQLTQAMVEKVKSETRSPITHVVVTHPNPDKFNGLPYLHALGVKSISSKGVATDLPKVHAYKKAFWTDTMKAFTPQSYPSFQRIQETFKVKKTIRLASGETVTLFALKNAGVASHQVVARIDATGDLIVGDLVHHNAHAWLEGPLVNGKPRPNISSWMAALDELPALSAGKPAAKVYGGRGEFVATTEAVQAQKRYLEKTRTIVADYVSGLGDRQRELLSPVDASPHYMALEQRLEAEFPAYKLPYMVRYSVYGLARPR